MTIAKTILIIFVFWFHPALTVAASSYEKDEFSVDCYYKAVTDVAQKCKGGDVIEIPAFQVSGFCDMRMQIFGYENNVGEQRAICVFRGETRKSRPDESSGEAP